jgi:hypothetical protein
MGLQVDDPFVKPGKVASNGLPTNRDIALQLRAVNPTTPTSLTLPQHVWNRIAPLYERLLLDQKRDKRKAWKRWRAAIEPIAQQLESQE